MGKTATEAIVSLIVIVITLMAPLLIGMGIYKFYRTIKPLPEVNPDEIKLITDIDKVSDRFFLKSLLIGWAICGPFYYWVMTSDMF
ncbi:MAG: hypothetical protein OQK04_15060 [Kangiellaceae bacterium]|nr:hypothetical protein [Kangiellaceae bacterium]MCW9000028.1 hypothetical protein [Kangiellaceae bacterium]